jgi:DNA helicase II / ATP-dependent DNA helicase PcrA
VTPSPTSSRPDEVLDAEQQAAVDAPERAIAVLAGPGSGKTRTLSFRARRLLMSDARSNALLLTFTNKAAAEMKARALHTASVPTKRLQASTFHTFCSELLRAHGSLVGIPSNFEILDEEEQRAFADDCASQAQIANLAKHWSRARLRRGTVSAAIQAFGDMYEQDKRDAGVVDYDDLIVYAATLLEGRPQIAGAYGAKFAHILVDEFQDTNAAQFAVISALSKHARSISIFADDDQAIFGFAGAESKHVAKFAAMLGAKSYPLTTNYRSRERIVLLANRLIRADPHSSGRQMVPFKTGGAAPLLTFDTIEQEAAAVASDIETLIASKVRPADISILVRSKKYGDSILRHLSAKKMPVSDWRVNTYVSEDRRTLATCLSVIRNRLSDYQAERLCDLLTVPPTPIGDALAFLKANHSKPGASGLIRVVELAFAGAAPRVIVQAAQKTVAAINGSLAASLDSIVEAVADFERFDPDFNLEHLLTELALGAAGRPPTEGGGIKLATLHRTKGLQWPYVYLLGLCEGHLPDFRTKEENMSEERRLCFVGVSRAQERLVLTFARSYKGYKKQPSRFLKEMGYYGVLAARP